MKVRLKEELKGISIGLVLFVIIYQVYDYQFPVVLGMQAETVDRQLRSVTVRVEGYKARECRLVPDSFTGWFIDPNDRWHEANNKMEFPKDASPNSNRPSGIIQKQDFGLFKISGISRTATKVRVTVEHYCDSDNTPRLTIMGPWVIPRHEEQ